MGRRAGSGWTLVFAEIIDIDEKVVPMMKKRKCQIGRVLLQGVPPTSRQLALSFQSVTACPNDPFATSSLVRPTAALGAGKLATNGQPQYGWIVGSGPNHRKMIFF